MRIHVEYDEAEGIVDLNSKVAAGWRLHHELHRDVSGVDRFLVVRFTEKDDDA